MPRHLAYFAISSCLLCQATKLYGAGKVIGIYTILYSETRIGGAAFLRHSISNGNHSKNYGKTAPPERIILSAI